MKSGDAEAAQRLWERFYTRMVRLARRRLRNLPRRAADEEDVALSAFNRFCQSARQGRFPRLADRNDLWELLVVLTDHKARDYARRERRKKCDAGRVEEGDPAAGDFMDLRATPEYAALLADEYRWLLQSLDDDSQRLIAVRKMEGYTNEEISGEAGCSLRTVERKLQLIRAIWERTSPDAPRASAC